jgi:SpoVK/Ycf46/Vps4 family AAA+-type ATPase
MITTNRLECIDEAIGIPKNGMSTRPGRIDRVVAVDVLPEECRREIAQHILDDWPEEVERVVRESDGYTGAQVTDLCIKLAEKKFWEKQ